MTNNVTNVMIQQTSENLEKLGYKNQGLIGQGAFSRVYRVRERVTGLLFACKVSEERDMLEREAYFLQQIDHPLFPKIYGVEYWGGQGFLFMEYVRGNSLRDLVLRRGKLSERQSARVGVALAEGLYYLHDRRSPVLFRDVKPENIMIQEDGSVRLLDLGSACELNDGRHVITGTRGYAAPEQWEKDGQLGFYSDVYAVGSVLYFMATGRRTPFVSDETKEMWKGVKLHRGVKHLIEDCLRENAGERVPDMQCLLHRLKPYADGVIREIWYLERRSWFANKADYIFQQNIRKSSV